MSIKDLSVDQIDEYERQLIAAFGDELVKGNVSLMKVLGWDEELFWFIRNGLVEKGILTKGGGKGGSSIRLAQPVKVQGKNGNGANAVAVAEAEAEAIKTVKLREIDLYPKIMEVLRKSWVKDHNIDERNFVELTAMSGRTETGGKWSRPDITLATCTTYAHVPQKFFDVITFEVKVVDGFDVTAVYEALAHRRKATHSWVILHVPQKELTGKEADIDEVQEEAKRHGIGLIVATKPDDYATWDERLPAIRQEPDPARLNEFLGQRSQPFKDTISKWFK